MPTLLVKDHKTLMMETVNEPVDDGGNQIMNIIMPNIGVLLFGKIIDFVAFFCITKAFCGSVLKWM